MALHDLLAYPQKLSHILTAKTFKYYNSLAINYSMLLCTLDELLHEFIEVGYMTDTALFYILCRKCKIKFSK